MSILTTCSLTFVDLNEIYISNLAPVNPTHNQIWFDTSLNVVKKYNSSTKKWEIINDYSQEIKDAIDDLQITGKNLLSDTATSKDIVCTGTTNTGANFNFIEEIDYLNDIKGNQITFAFDWEYIGNSPGGTFYPQTLSPQLNSFTPIVTISSSKKYGTQVYTTTINSTQDTTGIQFVAANVNGTLRITHPRLLFGSKDLGWSQAPEDVENKFQTIFERTAKGIYMETSGDGYKSLVDINNKNIKIASDSITLEGYTTINNKFIIDTEGKLSATDAKFSGDITSSSMNSTSITGGSITGSTINIGDNFSVNNQGDMIAKNASFTGNINSSSSITGSTITGSTITGSTFTSTNNKFKVLIDGTIEAIDGKFSGTITGSSINSTSITGGTIGIGGSSNNNFTVDASGNIVSKGTANLAQGNFVIDSFGNINVKKITATDSTFTGAITGSTISTNSNKFSVDSNGIMRCSGAIIDGEFKTSTSQISISDVIDNAQQGVLANNRVDDLEIWKTSAEQKITDSAIISTVKESKNENGKNTFAQQTDLTNAIDEATMVKADYIARNILYTPLVVKNPNDEVYVRSKIPNPPLGAVFSSYNPKTNTIRNNRVSSNGCSWGIIIAYELYKNTTDTDKKDEIKNIVGKISNFMITNVSVGRFNSMDFKFIDVGYKYDSSTNTWTKSNYKELYLTTMWLEIKALVYAYEILEDKSCLNLALDLLDTLINTHMYINGKVESGDLPSHLKWASYEYIACDNLSTSYRFIGSTKQYANQMGYYISQAIKEVIRVVGDIERQTPKGDSYKPSDILIGTKKYLKNAYDTQNLTTKPLGLPYGYFHRVTNNDGSYSYVAQNWDFIENTWGDTWFVGDVVLYIIYSFAACGLTDIATLYANNYYKTRVDVSSETWSSRFSSNELVFHDRIDFNTGNHLEGDNSISITFTALFYDILKEIGLNEYVDSCCYTLAKRQVKNPDDKFIDGAYPWDISEDGEALEFKSMGEIINSQFYKNLNITSLETIDNKMTEIKQTADQIKWVVKSGTSSSDMTLTDDALTVIAKDINLTGKVTFSSFDSELNRNSTNWSNAYNRVAQWAYGAVSGSTTINGGLIQTNTITAEKIAIGDFNNYAELNASTLSKWGWTSVADSSASSNPWFQKNTVSRDSQISKYYNCNGGESLRIKADIFTSVYGQIASGGTATATARPVGIMIFTINANGTRGYYCNSTVTATSTSGTTGTVNSVVTLPSTARQFAVYAHVEGYATFTGILRVRNVQVTKMTSGELIVDGSITTSMINTKGLNASVIKAGTISADLIDTETLRGKTITGGTISGGTVSGASISGGNVNVGSGKFIVDSSGNVTTAGNVTLGGTITASGNITATNLKLNGGSITLGSNFSVSSTGILTAKSASFTGSINSGSTITGATIDVGNGKFTVDSSGIMKCSGATFSGEINSSTISTASNKFSVDSDGIMRCSGAIIDGDFKTSTSQVSISTVIDNAQKGAEAKEDVGGLEVKVTQSGGYNLLKNSKGKNGTAYWLPNSSDSNISVESDSIYGTCFKSTFPRGILYGGGDDGWAIKLKNDTDYVYSAYIYSRETTSGSNVVPMHFWCSTTVDTPGQSQANILDYRQSISVANEWTKCYVHFKTASSGDVWFTPMIYNNTMTGDFWVTEISLTESMLELPWSPHPSEVYEGITTVDQDGIKISMGDGEGTQGFSRISYEGIATYDSNGNTRSWFGPNDTAYIKELNVDYINNPYILQCRPRTTNWYVSTYATGDGTGRNTSNKANSIQSVLEYIRQNNGCYTYRQDINIICDSGSNLNEDIYIGGWIGSGIIHIQFGAASVFTGYIRVEDSTTNVHLYGNRSGLYTNDGCMWYKRNGNASNVALAVRNATVVCQGFRAHRDSGYTGYGYEFAYVFRGGNLRLYNLDLVKYWSIFRTANCANIYLDNIRGDIGILSESICNSQIVISGYLPKFNNGNNISELYNSNVINKGTEGADSLWYPSETVSTEPTKSWHWVEKTFYFKLSSTTEGSGSATSGWSGKWGQGKWGSYKSHRGHAKPTESISTWCNVGSNTRNISMVLTMTRLNTSHGYAGAVPVPKIKQKDGTYWSSGVAFARGDTKSITLSSGVVTGLSDGTLTELTMWASTSTNDYSQYNTVSLKVKCEKYY